MPAHQRTRPSLFGKAGFSQYSLLLAMSCLLYSAASRAQAPPTVTDSREATEIDAVRVSASRIDRPDFVSPTPILPISAEELKLDMRPNVGAALNDLPQFRATSSPQTSGTSRATGNAVCKIALIDPGHHYVPLNIFGEGSPSQAAARVSDYAVTGNIWSWKIGATNAFFPGFRGRFTRSRDIRTADLYESFTTRSTFYIDVFDPINSTFSPTYDVLGRYTSVGIRMNF